MPSLHRVSVVVPAFNEARMIGSVTETLRGAGYEVIVVDDGSSDGTSDAARAAGARVVRHLINRGQGAALQTGISDAVRHGADFVVTFDADGQHRVEDIRELLRPLIRGDAQVVFGSRTLGSSEGIPRTRRILLWLGVQFTRLMSGVAVTDTHNGLRAFLADVASHLQVRQDRMAHPNEILDQVVHGGWRYAEVAVHVRYTPYSLAKGQRARASVGILLDYLLG